MSVALLFDYWEIYDEEKVKLESNKLEGEAGQWWEDIQIDRKRWGKHSIRSWQIMKKVLVDLWFSHYCYDILDYAIVNYRSAY